MHAVLHLHATDGRGGVAERSESSVSELSSETVALPDCRSLSFGNPGVDGVAERSESSESDLLCEILRFRALCLGMCGGSGADGVAERSKSSDSGSRLETLDFRTVRPGTRGSSGAGGVAERSESSPSDSLSGMTTLLPTRRATGALPARLDLADDACRAIDSAALVFGFKTGAWSSSDSGESPASDEAFGGGRPALLMLLAALDEACGGGTPALLIRLGASDEGS